MQTEVYSHEQGEPRDRDWIRIGQMLRAGALVVFPTETVYGIAVARDNPDAVRRLYCLKDRPLDKEMAVLLAAPDRALDFVLPAPHARRLMRRVWPGPLTLVLPALVGGHIGLRAPSHPLARLLSSEAGFPVLSTSANLAGQPPALDGETALKRFDGTVEAVITDGPTRYQEPSTVVRVDNTGLEILREGVVKKRDVYRCAAFTVLFVCTGNLCRSPMAEGILKALVAERLGIDVRDLLPRGIRIISAGTLGIDREPATSKAVIAAQRWGADISTHQSRPLTDRLIERADQILVAERHHWEKAAGLDSSIDSKDFPTRFILPGGEDLPDPIGRNDAAYARTALRIREALVDYADALVKVLQAEG